MTKPKGTNRKKVRAFCFAHFQKGGADHEQKKETADLAEALRRQSRSRGRTEESQAERKDIKKSNVEADPERKNPPPLHQSRNVGELFERANRPDR